MIGQQQQTFNFMNESFYTPKPKQAAPLPPTKPQYQFPSQQVAQHQPVLQNHQQLVLGHHQQLVLGHHQQLVLGHHQQQQQHQAVPQPVPQPVPQSWLLSDFPEGHDIEEIRIPRDHVQCDLSPPPVLPQDKLQSRPACSVPPMTLNTSIQNPTPSFPLAYQLPPLEGATQAQREWFTSLHSTLQDLVTEVTQLRQQNATLVAEGRRLKMVAELATQSAVTSPVNAPVSGVPNQATRNNKDKPLVLEMEGVNDEWFRRVKHDPVTVRLRSRCGDAGSDWRQAGPWIVRLRINDASCHPLATENERRLLGKTYCVELSPNTHPVHGEVLEGTLTGIKFLQVSKNFGGQVWLEAVLVEPNMMVGRVESTLHKMKIHSKRRKGSDEAEECHLDTPLVSVEGFGPTYASKFAKLGYSCVGDLLRFPLPQSDKPQDTAAFKDVMKAVRKPGGRSEKEFIKIIRGIQSRVQGVQQPLPSVIDVTQEKQQQEPVAPRQVAMQAFTGPLGGGFPQHIQTFDVTGM